MVYGRNNSVQLTQKYHVELQLPNGTIQHCYDVKPYNGWCGVCDPKADRGQEGFCGETSGQSWGSKITDSIQLLEATRPDPTSKWGWCSDNCYYRLHAPSPTASFLQVAHVHVLGEEDCVRMDFYLRVRSTRRTGLQFTLLLFLLGPSFLFLFEVLTISKV
jgi:hypothetical protein